MNRLLVAKELSPDKNLLITRTEAIKDIACPITDPMPTAVGVERLADTDLVSAVTFHWSNADALAVAKLVIPLWLATVRLALRTSRMRRRRIFSSSGRMPRHA